MHHSRRPNIAKDMEFIYTEDEPSLNVSKKATTSSQGYNFVSTKTYFYLSETILKVLKI